MADENNYKYYDTLDNTRGIDIYVTCIQDYKFVVVHRKRNKTGVGLAITQFYDENGKPMKCVDERG